MLYVDGNNAEDARRYLNAAIDLAKSNGLDYAEYQDALNTVR
jgi:hypothetical protein